MRNSLQPNESDGYATRLIARTLSRTVTVQASVC